LFRRVGDVATQRLWAIPVSIHTPKLNLDVKCVLVACYRSCCAYRRALIGCVPRRKNPKLDSYGRLGENLRRMKTGAKISPCNKYRYALWRVWDESLPLVMFIGLNPSTADATEDDPTIRRCIGFAKSWGYGGIQVGNLFAYRSTKPSKLYKASNPVGQDNDFWLKKLHSSSQIVIAAWGNRGTFLDRARYVCSLLPDIYCLGVTKYKQPRHPLYLKKSVKPVRRQPKWTSLLSHLG